MSALDDYRSALVVAHPDVSRDELVDILDSRGTAFPEFIAAHGLAPLWHERTGRPEFEDRRMQAEALFLVQEDALRTVGAALDAAGIAHAVFKGAANRALLYATPSVRACHDLDLLVAPDDRLRAAKALAEAGFTAVPNEASISRELMLVRGEANIDLHWGILREGRLRTVSTDALLSRRRRVGGLWMLDPGDGLFVMLVHSAFAKHLGSWELGLHRVVDILHWLRTQDVDRRELRSMLESNGVVSAAWATLRWVDLLTRDFAPAKLGEMLDDLEPGALRRSWIDFWLRGDLPGKTARARWARLLGFSMFLHDSVGDAMRAAAGRSRAKRRIPEDMAAFGDLLG